MLAWTLTHCVSRSNQRISGYQSVTQAYPSFSPLLVEWLQDSWLLASAEMDHSQLRGGVMLLTLLLSPMRYLTPAASRLLSPVNRELLRQNFADWTADSAEAPRVAKAGDKTAAAAANGESLLARYASNMTEQARKGTLNPVLCRDEEIDLMIDILCRRRKNNPIVVGEAGVGKSA